MSLVCCLGAVQPLVTGLLSWSSTAPSPLDDGSTGIVVSLFQSKLSTVVCIAITYCIFANASWWDAFHWKSSSCFIMSQSGAVSSASWGMNGDMYVTVPKNCCRHVLFVRAGVFLMSSMLPGSGWTPFASYIMPKKWIPSCPMAHFSLLNQVHCLGPPSSNYVGVCRALSSSFHTQQCHSQFQEFLGIPPGSGPSTAGKHIGTSLIRMAYAGSKTFQTTNWRLLVVVTQHLASSTSIHSSRQAWRSAGISRTGVWFPWEWECDDGLVKIFGIQTYA